MTLILGIDCCTGWTNAGLADSGEPVGELNLNLGRKQAGILPGMVSDLLSLYDYELTNIEKIAVTSGPGYFTGIRIGMTYAASLAYALGVEIISLSSLETLVPLNHPQDIPALTILPMGKKKVFAGIYTVTAYGRTMVIRKPDLFSPKELSLFIDNLDHEVLCYTCNPELARQVLDTEKSSNFLFSLSGGLSVSVRGYYKRDSSRSPEHILPDYMALPQTE